MITLVYNFQKGHDLIKRFIILRGATLILTYKENKFNSLDKNFG